jgi:hypothetical protein
VSHIEHNRNMCLIYTWPGISRSRPESEPSARLLDRIFSWTGRDSNIPDRRSREYASSPSFRSCTGRSPVSEQQVMIRENDGGGCLKRKKCSQREIEKRADLLRVLYFFGSRSRTSFGCRDERRANHREVPEDAPQDRPCHVSGPALGPRPPEPVLSLWQYRAPCT